MVATQYWEPRYNESETSQESWRLEDTYAALMRQAVSRMIPQHGQVFVSLSGGTDSRAILGLLLDELDNKDRLVAFSYGEAKNEDVSVAKKLCSYVGIEHQLLAYQGNIAKTIQQNGALSEGLVSFYTHGLDGLFTLQPQLTEESVVFVGDIAFRQGPQTFTTFNEMLTYGVGIRFPANIPSWYGYGNVRPKDIEGQLNSDAAALKKRVEHYANLALANQFLLLDQRQNYQILPWREFYTGRFMSVANPLIDEDILEFSATVPWGLSYDKLLHRQTIKKNVPRSLRIPLCNLRGKQSSRF